MKNLAIILIFLILISFLFSTFLISRSRRESGYVIEVIDGDTFLLEDGRRVRLSGINSPENGEYFYKEAKEKLKELIEGKKVELECSKKDKYGRFLCYVFINKTLVNLEMVKGGYAYLLSSPKYYEELFEAQSLAKKNFLGIWKGTRFSSCISVESFHYNARGNDNENLNDEYVILKNICNFSINMNNWKISDEGGNLLTFSTILEPNGLLKIYSGHGVNTKNEIFWNSEQAIWNNDGDTLYLKDEDGSLVLTYPYP